MLINHTAASPGQAGDCESSLNRNTSLPTLPWREGPEFPHRALDLRSKKALLSDMQISQTPCSENLQLSSLRLKGKMGLGELNFLRGP